MQLQNIVSIIGMVTGLAGLYIGLHEYIRQGRQKRFECYRGFYDQIQQYAVSYNLIELFEDDKSSIAKIDLQVRSEILGLLEAVSIALNSGLIREGVVFNFFGYYTIMIYQSDHYWNELGRDLMLWSEFTRLYNRMVKYSKKFKNSKSIKM